MVARRRTITVLIYALCFFAGTRSISGAGPQIQLLVSLCMAVLVTQFCIIDSHIQQKPLPTGVHWLIFMSWPISAPVYLFRSRGIRKAHWAAFGILGCPALVWMGSLSINLLLSISHRIG